eukprot:6045261-Pyramimonas_sp.AAC.1
MGRFCCRGRIADAPRIPSECPHEQIPPSRPTTRHPHAPSGPHLGVCASVCVGIARGPSPLPRALE